MQNAEGALNGTVTAEEADDTHFVTVGIVAKVLGVEHDEVTRLINCGLLNADADVSGRVLLFRMSDVMRCKAKLQGEG
jgi:phage regulator Rha-like protein